MFRCNDLVFVLLLLVIGCSDTKDKRAVVTFSDVRPVIDGELDACWENLPEYAIDGSIVGDINWDGAKDLSASFRVLMHDDDLFLLLKVFDDIDGKIEASASSQYWENDNVEFFFTNTGKLAKAALAEKDSIFFFNYSSPYDRLEKMVNVEDSKSQHVFLGRTAMKGGYQLEVLFEREVGVFNFKDGEILFNIEISDNDNTNEEEGFIKGRESGIAWSYNSARTSWLETLNYGKLVIDR